ncbi:unnamed protein product [Didymodactylos carnosus]|uniref:Tesmin/TSO1-like CXC domain-containing protein n=1 Tax=Didymodactylos carnosus TaxID=1234261 RepID=A0A814XCQ1_9BILA|nr:unnamed protein product [Didymodactylos carnosus]CAF1214525.1 unnamed protein product [Didymodactylos carnosus]CAF3538464.1 unnamed protein product [Didymodactylos carnosus]CAF3978388.1 unnamed protein product [Didymodactylos carnosus]
MDINIVEFLKYEYAHIPPSLSDPSNQSNKGKVVEYFSQNYPRGFSFVPSKQELEKSVLLLHGGILLQHKPKQNDTVESYATNMLNNIMKMATLHERVDVLFDSDKSYDCQSNTLDEARVICAKKFIQGKSSKSFLERLPPTSDGFSQHLIRANVQINVWFQACESDIDYPELNNNGYEKVNNELVIKWKTLESHPKLTGCKCKTNCKTCQCKNSSCTFLCKCDPQKCLRRSRNTTQQTQRQSSAYKDVGIRTRHAAMLTNNEDSSDDDIIDRRTLEKSDTGEDSHKSSENEYTDTDHENSLNELYELPKADPTNSQDDEDDDFNSLPSLNQEHSYART